MNRQGLLALALCSSLFAANSGDAVSRWWSHVEALSNDSLQGRDTGGEGYRRAAQYVVAQLQRNGVKPAGEHGFYQPVPLHRIELLAAQSAAVLGSGDVIHHHLRWLHDLTITPQPGLPDAIDAGLIFAGDPAGLSDTNGKILVRFAPSSGTAARPAPLPPGIAGTLTIDSVSGPEPRHWPMPYAVTMTLRDAPQPRPSNLVSLRFNPASAETLFEGSGHTYAELQALAASGKPLPNFALRDRLRAGLRWNTSDLTSDNVIGVLPGSDPALSQEYVVVSAHLDGYGIGEPRNGDRIYNGTFDDAAYVATLIDLAEKLHHSGNKLRRSLLFVVVTAEEKGLLGSRYFVAHPTVPKNRMVADVNLDQLRPIFPLKMLTALALDESTLGDTARQVAETMRIRIQPDPEPERNLLRRSDHYNFMQIGVPAIGFIFGYEKGSPEEAIYRRWYDLRYHSPADDLRQPWDREAAANFNEFFDRLVVELAKADHRPQWKPGSSFSRPVLR